MFNQKQTHILPWNCRKKVSILLLIIWSELSCLNISTSLLREASDTRATWTTQVTQDNYKNYTSATWGKSFDNDTSENILFLHPYISYMTNERLQGEKQLNFRNYLLKISCSHDKISLKSAPPKLIFVIAKGISKIYTTSCSFNFPSTFLHSYA